MKLSHILISTVIMTVIFPNPTTIALLSLKLTNKCVKCKLLGVNIQNADLSGADLRNADLRWAKLSVVNLNDADLSGANLKGARLNEVTMKNTKLCGATLMDSIKSSVGC